MALIKCEECGNQISDEAKRCPKCGAKVPKHVGIAGKIVAAVVLIFIFKGAYESSITPPPPEKTPAQLRYEAQQAEKARAIQSKLKLFKTTLHDPSSLDLTDVILLGNNTICLTYRAKNAMGATVLDQKAILENGKIDSFSLHCKGHNGENFTHLR